MAQNVSEFMTPNPATIPAGMSAMDAARLMRDRDVGDVIVLDDNKVVGIVTDRDIVVRVLAHGQDPASVKIADFCSKDLHMVEPTTTVEQAINLMRDKAVRRLPVLENGRPVGIVSIGDLAMEQERQSVLGDISAAPPNI